MGEVVDIRVARAARAARAAREASARKEAGTYVSSESRKIKRAVKNAFRARGRPLTAHEIARRLLEMPEDAYVCVGSSVGSGLALVSDVYTDSNGGMDPYWWYLGTGSGAYEGMAAHVLMDKTPNADDLLDSRVYNAVRLDAAIGAA